VAAIASRAEQKQEPPQQRARGRNHSRRDREDRGEDDQRRDAPDVPRAADGPERERGGQPQRQRQAGEEDQARPLVLAVVGVRDVAGEAREAA